MRSRYRVLEPHAPHFVTSTVVGWLPIFTTKARCDILVDSLKYCREHKQLRVYAWVILDNHFHALVGAPDLARVMADLKRHTAQRIVEQLERENCEWLLRQLEFFLVPKLYLGTHLPGKLCFPRVDDAGSSRDFAYFITLALIWRDGAAELPRLGRSQVQLGNEEAGNALVGEAVLPHASSMRSRYRVLEPHAPHFVTSTVVAWLPVFTTKARCDILVDSLKYCREHKQLRVYAWVILDNHFHAVVEAPDLARVMADLKRHTAQRIVEQLERENCEWLLRQLEFYRAKHKTESRHQIWQEGFHPQAITDDKTLEQKMDYIHDNPVVRGLVAVREHWRYSSAHEWLTGAEPCFRCDRFDVA